VKNDEKPTVNPLVVLREEFDDWAVLFDPDSGNAFGLSPTGVYLWKHLDGKHTLDALLQKIRNHADNAPEGISDHIKAFVDELVAEGLAGFDSTECGPEKSSSSPPEEVSALKPFTYEPPKLVDLSGEQTASGATCSSHGSAGGSCYAGAGATVCCNSGTCGSWDSCCGSGTCPDAYGDRWCYGGLPACTGGCVVEMVNCNAGH
jgi:SynChlorMet cassette protein ScmD